MEEKVTQKFATDQHQFFENLAFELRTKNGQLHGNWIAWKFISEFLIVLKCVDDMGQ